MPSNEWRKRGAGEQIGAEPFLMHPQHLYEVGCPLC